MPADERIPVIVVEDTPEERAVAAEALRISKEFRCVGEYSNAEAALASLSQAAPALALLDLSLPGMSGIELIPRLLGKLPNLKIIVVTHHDDDGRLFEAISAGALGYLLKPVDPAGIGSALSGVNAGNSIMSPPIARRILRAFQKTTRSDDGVDQLTDMHRQLLDLITQGCPIKEVAGKLGCSERTVYLRLQEVYRILQVKTRMEAVAKYAGTARS